MTVKQLMTAKPAERVKDKYSGAEFTVGELTAIVAQMVVTRQYSDADAFAERFEAMASK